MKIIIGAGCIGLSIAYKLLEKFKKADDIIIIDRYNIPSKGTSLKNSGVLHAGLYYPPGSEKSNLCINGAEMLRSLCIENNLPLLECGKLIISNTHEEEVRLENLYKNSLLCKRNVRIINHQEASKIQPNINFSNMYLWSPKTCVFSPSQILNFFYRKLFESGAIFIKDKVLEIDNINSLVTTENNGKKYFESLFNCAGPGALNLCKENNSNYKNLSLLPILGQYGIIPKKESLKTNIYPVPDPNLPFLGIHITPMINGNILVGPNAIPIYKKDVQGFDINDLISIFPNIYNHTKLFISNSQNYRKHALKELNINILKKFRLEISKLIMLTKEERMMMHMGIDYYGIRPQLYDHKKNRLINDFIYHRDDNIIHMVNAVSPAFSSCLSLSEKMIDLIL